MTPIEYITTAGGNRYNGFRSDIILSANTEIVLDCQVDSHVYASWQGIIGARNVIPVFGFYSRMNGENVFGIEYGNTVSGPPRVTAPGIYDARITLTINSSGATWSDGTTTQQVSAGISVPIGSALYFFGTDFTGAAANEAGMYTIYSVIVRSNGNITHNLVPMIDDNDVACLHDLITDATYYPDSGTWTAGPIITNSYTVSYNSNGGSGTMLPQTIDIDVPTPLSPCTFTAPDELSFAGWALSAAGEPVYSDGQTVTNLAAAGETVQLFAAWRAVPGFEIRVQYNASEVNRLDKEITDIMVLRGILRAESSIIDPVFMVQGSLELLAGANYLTIPIWGRKYFIRDIVSIRTNLVQISAHVDVLSSWPDELRACKGIVHRQERDWNLYLNDGAFRVYQNPDVFTQPFPSGFNAMAFVLAVAGGTGSSVAAAPEEAVQDGV